jgi:ubiquinone/menaquinone biosynthesis C-methylase UbiE
MMIRHTTRLYYLIFSFFVLTGCSTHQVAESDNVDSNSSSVYSFQAPSWDGSGKIYMGREIAGVMDPDNASWLERPNRKVEEMPDQVIRHMNLKPDEVVADVGAGTGYFTFRLSPMLPGGKILAVEIQLEMLEIIKKRAREMQVKNVFPIRGTLKDPNLPDAGVDAVLMVDAYHEFSYPREMMEAIIRALKPDGRVVVIEYRGEDPQVAKPPHHKMTEAQLIKEMAAVGLRWQETKDFLPQQHFMIFERLIKRR